MPLTSVFSQQVSRGNAVNTGYQVSAGALWFVQWGGVADSRFSQLGVAALRSVDEPISGYHAEFSSRIIYAAFTGMVYDLPDQIPQAILWLYVSKSCIIPDPVLTVYQI